MKLYKIFAAALAILTMTACDDDDPVNTADVTVNMQETSLTIAEDFQTGVYYYIPVTLSGETNGPVTVTVQVDGFGSNPATEDRDYMVTSKTIVIPAGKTEGAFEFHASSNDEINEDRQFTFTIVSASGARIGNNTTTLVTLVDEDHLLPDALNKLVGTWSTTSNSAGAHTCTISEYPEGDPDHLKKVKLSGLVDDNLGDVVLDFSLDASTGLISLSMSMPQTVGKDIPFSRPAGSFDIVVLPYDGGLYLGGTAYATSNEDITQFIFDIGWAAGMFSPGNHSAGGFSGYVYDRTSAFSLTKVQ